MSAVVSVRNVPGTAAPLAPAIYTARLTTSGAAAGVWKWRCTERKLLGTVAGKNGTLRERGVYTAAKAQRLAEEIAAARGLPFLPNLYHGCALTPDEIQLYTP